MEPIIRTFKSDIWAVNTNSARFVLDSIKKCLEKDDAKGHYWELDNESLGGLGYTTSSNYVDGLVIKNNFKNYDGTNGKIQKLSFRTLNSVTLAVALHPDGENTYINSLPLNSVSPVKNYLNFNGATPSFSGELRITGGRISYTTLTTITYPSFIPVTSSASTLGIDNNSSSLMTGWIIELPDSISIFFKSPSSERWICGLHAGKIFQLIDSFDQDIHEGSGILVGDYQFRNNVANVEHYINRSTLPQSTSINFGDTMPLIYVGNNTWKRVVFINELEDDLINNEPRLKLIKILSAKTAVETNSSVIEGGLSGTLKYIRFGPSSTALNFVLNRNDNNKIISWINQRSIDSGGSTNIYHIWKRDVDPIAAV